MKGKTWPVDGRFTEEIAGETFVFREVEIECVFPSLSSQFAYILCSSRCLRCTDRGLTCAICLSGTTKTCGTCRRARAKCVWPEGASGAADASPSTGTSPEPERENTSEDDAPPRKKRKVCVESGRTPIHAAHARARPKPVATLNDRGLLLASLTEMDEFLSVHDEVQDTYESAINNLSRMHKKMKRSRRNLSTWEDREEAILAEFAAREASLDSPRMSPSDE